MSAKTKTDTSSSFSSSVLELIQRIKTGNLDTRESAVFELSKQGNTALPALIAALDDEDNNKYWIIVALREINSPDAVSALIKTLSDPDEYVRKISAETLGRLRHPQALPGLIKSLSDADDGVRSTAAEALGKLHDQSAVAPLAELLLKDGYGNVREMASRALGEIGGEAALAPLLQALKDPKENVRAGAGEALGKIKNPETADALRESLQDADWGVRRNAAWALGEMLDKKSLPALLAALKDPDPAVKMALIKTLEKLNAPQAAPELVLLLSDEIEAVRKAAAKALKILGDAAYPPSQIGKALALAGEGKFTEAGEILASAPEAKAQSREQIPLPSLIRLAERNPQLKNWLQEQSLVPKAYSLEENAPDAETPQPPSPLQPAKIKLAAEIYNQVLNEQISSLKFQEALLTQLNRMNLKFKICFWETAGYNRVAYLEIKDRENNRSFFPLEIGLDLKEAVGQRFFRDFFTDFYTPPPESLAKAFVGQILTPAIIHGKTVQKGSLKYRPLRLEEETRQQIREGLKQLNQEKESDSALLELQKHAEVGLPLLIKALEDPQQKHREELALILGEAGEEGAVPYLIAALKENSPSLQNAAREALYKLGELESPAALYGLAVAREQSGDSSSAVSALLAAVKLDPELSGRAKTEPLLAGSEFQQLWEIQKKTEKKITDAEYWYNKGLALGEAGKHEEEIKCYNKALALNPRYFEAWYNKGLALGELGRHEEEIECYEIALEIYPEDPETWYNKGLALRELNRTQEEIDCYARAVLLKPDYAEAWYNKAVALGEMGKTQEEIDDYRQVLQLTPLDTDAWFNQGLALKKLGKAAEAEQCFDRLLELNPDDYNHWFQKGLLQEGRKAYAEALATFSEALSRLHTAGEAWYHLGFCQEKTGKTAEALLSYDQALRLNPELEGAGDRKNRLNLILKIKNLLLERASERQSRGSASSSSLGELLSLGKINHLLFKLLKDQDHRIKIETVLTLGEMKNPNALQPLLETLKALEPEVRKAAVISLGKMESESAFLPLRESLNDAVPEIRKTVMLALIHLNPRESGAIILPQLNDRVPALRSLAARLLGELNAGEATAALILALNDPEPEVQIQAAKALGRLKAQLALNPLQKLLNSENPELQRTALETVRIINPQASFKLFPPLLDSPDEQTRALAALALGESRREEAVKFLTRRLKDPHWGVRLAVSRALKELAAFHPDSALALYGLGAALLQEGKNQEAIPVFKKAFELEPGLRKKAPNDPLLAALKIKP